MLPLTEDELRRWVVELEEAEDFRDKEFGHYRKDGKSTTGSGVNLDYFEYGANVREGDQRAPINLAFVLCKNIVPLLFPQNPRVLSFPTRKQDAASAPIAASLLNHYLRLLKVKETDQQVVFDTWLLGYGVSKAGYLTERGPDVARTKQEESQRLRDKLKTQTDKLLVSMGLKQPKPEEPEPVALEEDFIRAENPYLRWVDPFDFLIDPRARSIRDAGWVSETYRRTLDQVKANKHYGDEKSKLIATPIEDKDIPQSQLDRFQTVELHEIHYKNAEAPNGITVLILAESNGQLVKLYHEHSAYERMRGWQYDLLAFNKHNHKLYPVSDLSQARPLIDRLNNTFVAILEQVDKFVSKILVNIQSVKATGMTNLQNNQIGSVVEIDGPPDEAVRMLQMDQVKQDLLVLMERILDLVVLVTGLTRAQLTGLSSAQTATEAQIGQGGSQNRRVDQTDAVMEFVTDQVEKLWAVITQFVDLEEVQLLSGEPLYEDETGLPRYSFMDDINPDQAETLRHGNYRFQIEVTSMQRPNMEILRKQIENMAVVLTNAAIHQQLAAQGKMFDVSEGLRIWLRLYPELIADVNRLIRPITPPVQQGLMGGAPTPGQPGASTTSMRQGAAPNTADIISGVGGEKGQMSPLA